MAHPINTGRAGRNFKLHTIKEIRFLPKIGFLALAKNTLEPNL